MTPKNTPTHPEVTSEERFFRFLTEIQQDPRFWENPIKTAHEGLAMVRKCIDRMTQAADNDDETAFALATVAAMSVLIRITVNLGTRTKTLTGQKQEQTEHEVTSCINEARALIVRHLMALEGKDLLFYCQNIAALATSYHERPADPCAGCSSMVCPPECAEAAGYDPKNERPIAPKQEAKDEEHE